MLELEADFKSSAGSNMKIGELSAASGIPAPTIRFWERSGLLKPPARVSGQRRYTPDALHLLAVLKLAQSCGFTLAEMRQLLHGFTPGSRASQRWRQMAVAKVTELDRRIEQLRAMRELVSRSRDCDCSELVECGRIAVSATQGQERKPARRSELSRGPHRP